MATSPRILAQLDERPRAVRASAAAVRAAHVAHLGAARRRSGRVLVRRPALTEVYALLTTMPLQPRIAASTARRLVRDNVEQGARIVALSRRNVSLVLDEVAAADRRGDRVFDGLSVRAAREAEVERLVTLRPAHLLALWPEAPERIQAP